MSILVMEIARIVMEKKWQKMIQNTILRIKDKKIKKIKTKMKICKKKLEQKGLLLFVQVFAFNQTDSKDLHTLHLLVHQNVDVGLW